MDGSEALAADSDFERTFGVVDTCSNNGGGDEVGAALPLGTYPKQLVGILPYCCIRTLIYRRYAMFAYMRAYTDSACRVACS